MKVKNFLTKDTWTKHVFARKKDAMPCLPLDPDARKWCLAGAIIRAYQSDPKKLNVAMCRVLGWMGPKWHCLSHWNDEPDRTWKDVKALLNKLDL